ncbi:MAG: serine/threonine-protein kinase [Polyangiaceae bacterium]
MDSDTNANDPVITRANARVGSRLRDKWHLDVLLGVGGMAAVYAGTHRNGSRAAIKVLHPELSAHTDIRSRFFREGRVANTVQHPGAVSVLDEDEAEDGSVFLVMELLDGESLEARASRQGGSLPVDEVLAATDQLLDVLVAAHAKGVIHRDLKPENLFLTRDGVVKVLDFGIARLRELSSQSHATRDGSTMGTPAFMAPEQARGVWDEVDGGADLWAVGATMFALITGRPVHQGRTVNEILVAAVTKKATPLAEAAAGVPKPVADLVDKALAFDKEARWPDAAAMQNAVRHAFHALHGAPISTHPKLTVPESVPNRTLASADVAPIAAASVGTGPAVASGRTGVPLHQAAGSGLSRPALVAGGLVGSGFLVAAAVVAIMLMRSRAHDTSLSAASAPAQSSPALVATAEPDAGTPAAPSVAPATSVISVDDLPAANTAPPKHAPPPRPAKIPPLTKPPTTSWKEQRK